MIRDICFKSREYVQLEAAEGREYVALSSADLNGDGIAEIVAFSLNGDVVVYKVCYIADIMQCSEALNLLNISYRMGLCLCRSQGCLCPAYVQCKCWRRGRGRLALSLRYINYTAMVR